MALRVGVVGAGRTGFQRARRLQADTDAVITAVSDPNRVARDAFARTFGVNLSVSDHLRLASDELVDVVYVCSPPATHSTIAVDSLGAGKDVICEPPLATSMAQADEIVSAAETTGRWLFTALPHRYDPFNQEALRILDAGEIGYPFMVQSSYVTDEFSRLNDWHDWKGTWDLGGGGVLMQYGCQMVDLLEYLMGDIEGVSAVCTRFAIEPLNKAEDSCLMTMEFVEEATAELAITGAARYSSWPEEYTGELMRVEIFGIEGSIQISSAEPKLVVAAGGHKRTVITESEIKTDLPTNMDRDFLASIAEDRQPFLTLSDSLDALRVVLAGYKASQMKRRVETLEHL